MLLQLDVEHTDILYFCEVPIEGGIDLFIQIIYHVTVCREADHFGWVKVRFQ